MDSSTAVPKIKRSTLREQAYQALSQMILSYRFTPGKWLNAERLAKELGVSRTPVWLALKDLEKEGLVEHVPRQGMRMARMTPQMTVDLYRVREVLEDMATGLAAEKIDDGGLSRLAEILKEQRGIVEGNDLLAYSMSDLRFHGVIYEFSGNWLLQELLNNVKNRYRPLNCDISPILTALYQDHVEVFNALKGRDTQEARRIICLHNSRMRSHIERTLLEKIGKAGTLE